MIRRLFSKTLAITAIFSSFCLSAHGLVGLYGGVALGGAHLSNKHNLHVNRLNGAGVAFPQNYALPLANQNLSAEVFGGYGIMIQQIWLAVEAHASLSKLETKALLDISGIGSSQELNIKSKHALGASVHIGTMIQPQTKVYFKLGLEHRKFESSFNGANQLGDALLSHNRSHRSTAFVPGFGVDHEINELVSLRSEYRVAFHPVREHVINADNRRTSLKNKATFHHVLLGLHFRV